MAARLSASEVRLRYFTGRPSCTLPRNFTVKVRPKGLSAVGAFIRLTQPERSQPTYFLKNSCGVRPASRMNLSSLSHTSSVTVLGGSPRQMHSMR